MENQIQKIKRFNRFYLNVVGLYTQYTDGSPYSMSEAMILFEINEQDKCTASELSEFFEFDKGYVSRIINKLNNRGLIRRVSSENDKRKKYLHITNEGENVLKELSNKASDNVRRMIEKVNNDELDSLIKSMEDIERILSLTKGGKSNV
ncbi:MarR family winged helix-turn-helix transcriptional regulator [Robertmurraya massiliosenegalensis]|uniref:MarR family winged helix-turn-helix transcriptional regulator n=1 Tax=Robertmurraya TaxID=2837507 RepID=UPI0039A5FA30